MSSARDATASAPSARSAVSVTVMPCSAPSDKTASTLRASTGGPSRAIITLTGLRGRLRDQRRRACVQAHRDPTTTWRFVAAALTSVAAPPPP